MGKHTDPDQYQPRSDHHWCPGESNLNHPVSRCLGSPIGSPPLGELPTGGSACWHPGSGADAGEGAIFYGASESGWVGQVDLDTEPKARGARPGTDVTAP